MHHFLGIITLPDNIAIVIMIVTVVVATAVAVREMRKNDRLIAEGKKDEVYKRMTQF